jgi:hypothetical protein
MSHETLKCQSSRKRNVNWIAYGYLNQQSNDIPTTKILLDYNQILKATKD